MDPVVAFEAERPRLVAVAARLLSDRSEAEDVVQQAWLRLHRTTSGDDAQEVVSVPAWLTTAVGRLCLDRLRQRRAEPEDDLEELAGASPDPGPEQEAVLADAVSAALQVVLDRLAPRERVAFVLHDTFGVDFPAVAEVLGTSPVAARKLASRARGKLAGAGQLAGDDGADRADRADRADGHDGEGADDGGRTAARRRAAQAVVVDAFMAAARGGDLARLLALLAPGAVISADAAAVAAGTPARVRGREQVAAFFDGSARSALAVEVDGRPGAAWYLRGQARVLFDVVVDAEAALVLGVVFRADPGVLARVRRRTTGEQPGHT